MKDLSLNVCQVHWTIKQIKQNKREKSVSVSLTLLTMFTLALELVCSMLVTLDKLAALAALTY